MTYIYPFGIFWMIMWWVLIIAAIMSVIRWITGGNYHNHRPSREDVAELILKERYAKGEINKEEFVEKKKVLSQVT